MDLRDLARLRQPTDVVIAGLAYTIRCGDVRSWVAAASEPVPVLALLEFGQAQRLNQRIYDRLDPVDTPDLLAAWRDALAAQSGYPWYVAERLLHSMAGEWVTVAGHLALKGLDALTEPLDLILAATMAMLTEGMDAKAKRAFEAEMWAVPPDFAVTEGAPRPGFTPEEQGAAWKAAARTSGIRS